MMRTLRKLFRPSNQLTVRSPRLVLEALEDRLTMSSPGTLDPLLAGSGRVTTTFDRVGTKYDYAQDVAVQANGKIVVVGSSHYGTLSDYDFAVSRYNPDGSLDSSFDLDGRAIVTFDRGGTNGDFATALALDRQGRILVAGSVDVAGNTQFGITRLLSNGLIDTTFGTNGRVVLGFDYGGSNYDGATGIAVDSLGRIVVTGSVARSSSGDFDWGVMRLTDSGALDGSFGFGGRSVIAFDMGGSLYDSAQDVAIDSQGRIVIAGMVQVGASDYDFGVARLTTSGFLDSTFDGDGRRTVSFNIGGGTYDYAYGLAVDSLNRIVVAGSAYSPSGSDFAVARLTTSGALDTAFSGDGRHTVSFDRGNNYETASDVAIDQQGRIVVGGTSHYASGDYDFAAVRLTTGGALDTTFDLDGRAIVAFDNGNGNYDGCNAVTIDREGRVLLAGQATQTDRTNFALARLGGGSMIRVVDASGDGTLSNVYRSGALRVSYDFASPPVGTISSISVEGVIGGVTRTLATYFSNLAWTGTRLVSLANVLNLAGGVYSIRVRVNLTNLSSVLSSSTSVTVQTGNTTSGTFAGETFTVLAGNGNGQVFRGLGGTDTLNLNVAASAIASVNGVSFADFVSSRTVARQAIYRGSAYDFVRFTDGREVYFQGFERIQVTGAVHEIALRPNDPEFVNQWNLHTTDVPSAWRFTTGASNVLLVSLDTGVLVPAGGAATRAVRDQVLGRLVTDSTDDDQATTYGHGHASISVMSGATNNAQGVAGVNWNATVFVADVYSGVTLQTAITDALNYARARGMRVVFQGGIQGEFWLTSGGTQAQLEALMSNNEDISLYAVAAGNGNQSTTATGNNLTAGVARLQTSHGNVMAIGALERTGTTVNGLANATAVNRASYSNFGPDLTIMAPTDSLALDQLGLTTFNGTSCANPNMAGMSSLVWSVNPMLNGNQVRQVLLDTATDIGVAGRDDTFGRGVVNTDMAVRRASALFRDEEVARLVADGSTLLQSLPPAINLRNAPMVPSVAPAVMPSVGAVLEEDADSDMTSGQMALFAMSPEALMGFSSQAVADSAAVADAVFVDELLTTSGRLRSA